MDYSLILTFRSLFRAPRERLVDPCSHDNLRRHTESEGLTWVLQEERGVAD